MSEEQVVKKPEAEEKPAAPVAHEAPKPAAPATPAAPAAHEAPKPAAPVAPAAHDAPRPAAPAAHEAPRPAAPAAPATRPAAAPAPVAKPATPAAAAPAPVAKPAAPAAAAPAPAAKPATAAAPADILDLSIDSLKLDELTSSHLKEAGITTLRDIVILTKDELESLVGKYDAKTTINKLIDSNMKVLESVDSISERLDKWINDLTKLNSATFDAGTKEMNDKKKNQLMLLFELQQRNKEARDVDEVNEIDALVEDINRKFRVVVNEKRDLQTHKNITNNKIAQYAKEISEKF